MRRSLRLTSLAVLLAALSACGGSGPVALEAVGNPAASIALPPEIAGLKVLPEKDATKSIDDEVKALNQKGSTPYVKDSVIYGLREGEKELKAVLQISRLTTDSRPEDFQWRKDIVQQIGRGAVASPNKYGDVLVYDREGTKQNIHIWFVDSYMYVLIIRNDESVTGLGLGFDPEALIEGAIAVHPS